MVNFVPQGATNEGFQCDALQNINADFFKDTFENAA
jgi:hypothetical protein